MCKARVRPKRVSKATVLGKLVTGHVGPFRVRRVADHPHIPQRGGLEAIAHGDCPGILLICKCHGVCLCALCGRVLVTGYNHWTSSNTSKQYRFYRVTDGA